MSICPYCNASVNPNLTSCSVCGKDLWVNPKAKKNSYVPQVKEPVKIEMLIFRIIITAFTAFLAASPFLDLFEFNTFDYKESFSPLELFEQITMIISAIQKATSKRGRSENGTGGMALLLLVVGFFLLLVLIGTIQVIYSYFTKRKDKDMYCWGGAMGVSFSIFAANGILHYIAGQINSSYQKYWDSSSFGMIGKSSLYIAVQFSAVVVFVATIILYKLGWSDMMAYRKGGKKPSQYRAPRSTTPIPAQTPNLPRQTYPANISQTQPKTQSAQSPYIAPNTAPSASSANEWRCTCGHINQMVFEVCSMCGNIRSQVNSPSVARQGIRNFSAPQANQNKAVTSGIEKEEANIQILREYKALLDSGVITQEDFEAKKKELL